MPLPRLQLDAARAGAEPASSSAATPAAQHVILCMGRPLVIDRLIDEIRETQHKEKIYLGIVTLEGQVLCGHATLA
jgi:hypothetical protein